MSTSLLSITPPTNNARMGCSCSWESRWDGQPAGPVKAGAGGVAAARIRGSPARPVPMSDPALDALMLPFADRRLAWPEAGALFLRAREGAALHAHAPRERVVCEQSFRPAHDALQRAGFQVRAGGGDAFPLLLALPPRQRDEAR